MDTLSSNSDTLNTIWDILDRLDRNENELLSFFDTILSKNDPELVSTFISGKIHDSSIFHILIINNNVNFLRCILKKIPDSSKYLNCKNPQGRTPLMIATILNRCDMIETILSYGVLINEQDFEGNTALHSATRCVKSSKIVQLLLQNGADINLRNKENKTPLNYAIEMGYCLSYDDNASTNRDLLVNYQELPPY